MTGAWFRLGAAGLAALTGGQRLFDVEVAPVLAAPEIGDVRRAFYSARVLIGAHKELEDNFANTDRGEADQPVAAGMADLLRLLEARVTAYVGALDRAAKAWSSARGDASLRVGLPWLIRAQAEAVGRSFGHLATLWEAFAATPLDQTDTD
jgi:hypothetical protein